MTKFEIGKTYVDAQRIGKYIYFRYFTVKAFDGKYRIGGSLETKVFDNTLGALKEVSSSFMNVYTKICKVRNEDRQKTTDLLYTFYSDAISD